MTPPPRPEPTPEAMARVRAAVEHLLRHGERSSSDECMVWPPYAPAPGHEPTAAAPSG